MPLRLLVNASSCFPTPPAQGSLYLGSLRTATVRMTT
jgi:hypothetical protein